MAESSLQSELIDRVPEYADLLRLDGRRFVALGTGDGTGRQAASALHQLGARVACLDVVAERAKKVAGEVDGIAIDADATDRASMIDAFARAEEELGGIDGIVDVIGRNRPRRDPETVEDHWHFIFDMCLMHAAWAVEIGGPALERAGGGTMTFVASTLAFNGAPVADSTAYAAAKASLVSLVKSAALQLAPAGVRVNAVAPGTVATADQLRNWGDKAAANIENRAKGNPLHTVNKTADVAATLLFLSSPLSTNITGQTIFLDGGRSASP